MTTQIAWDNEEKTTIILKYTEPTTADDVINALSELGDVLDTVDHKVSLIVDMTEVKTLPSNLLGAYPQMARTRGVSHPNVAISYVAINNEIIEMITSIFSRLYARFKVVRTVDAARQAIQHNQGTGRQ